MACDHAFLGGSSTWARIRFQQIKLLLRLLRALMSSENSMLYLLIQGGLKSFQPSIQL